MRLDPDKDELEDIYNLRSLITGQKITHSPRKKNKDVNDQLFTYNHNTNNNVNHQSIDNSVIN